MMLHISRLPFSLDPLMVEAKRRARRRRLILFLALAAGAVAAVTFSLQSGGGSGGESSLKSNVQPPRQTPPPHRVSSIQVVHDGPLSSVNMMVNNMWQGRVGNRRVLAYAGMWNTDLNSVRGGYEPAVMLFAYPSRNRIGVYPARGSETSVKFTAAKGNILTLVGVGPGSRGQSFRFNVATHAYSR